MAIKTPFLAVDAIIAYPDNRIILIQRKNPPYGWALPGGFVDVGEGVEDAVIREAKEETGIDFHNFKLLGVYSDPERDVRGHCVSVVFYGYPLDSEKLPSGMDDAKEAKLFDMEDLPSDMAFDHKKIIMDYKKKKDEEF